MGINPDPTRLSKFSNKKWIEIFDQSNGTYNAKKNIRFKAPQLRYDFCDFDDAYIAVTGKIITTNPSNNNNVYNRKVALKNSAPFFNRILKINSQIIEHVQSLDMVMPMYNSLYYSKNLRKTSGSFWNYYPDKPNSGYNRGRIFYPIKNSERFDYKTKLVGSLPAGNNEAELEDIKIVAPLKN